MKEGRAIPLSQSGSGISQVLGILYVILIAEFPKTIIIDEPTTFLHAGALRKLIEVMRNSPVSHQYIFTTHSPEVIAITDPDTLLICRWESGQTILERLDRTKLTDHRRAMQEVGVRYSDVLGADRILWAEGATEEVCFPMILRHFDRRALVGTAIIGLRNTGDLLAKRRSAKAVAEILPKA
jgi:predicted ATP-dependent endonuclease of OLD family